MNVFSAENSSFQSRSTNSARGRVFIVSALVISIIVAFMGASEFVAGANDSSRLASIDALVRFHSLRIDDSVFNWSTDRMFIDGHFYSDKPLVPSFMLAIVAQIAKWVANVDAQTANYTFVTWMSLANSGLAFVASVYAFAWVVRSRLPGFTAPGILLGSFALGSLAPVYAQNVNASIVVLATGMCATVAMIKLRDLPRQKRRSSLAIPALMGVIASIDYAFEVVSGLFLFLLLAAYIAYRCELSLKSLFVFGLAATPLIIAHHALNYAVGGTISPANVHPDVFRYPGSEIDPAKITGLWTHPSALYFVKYTAKMIIGARGILLHTPTMALAMIGVLLLARDMTGKPARSPVKAHGVLGLEIVVLVLWVIAIWILYAALSTDAGGSSVSIRWLLPALAPTYLIMTELLRERPGLIRDFSFLAVGQAVVTIIAWRNGPLNMPNDGAMWQVGLATILCWAAIRAALWLRARNVRADWSS